MNLEVGGVSYRQISLCALISYLFLSSFNGLLNESYGYMLWPSIWIVFCLVIKYKLPKPKRITPLVIRNKVKVIGLMGAICILTTYLAIGIIQGFGRNPGVVNSQTVILNIWITLPIIVAREYVRSYLIETYARKKQISRLIIISILMIITSGSLVRISYRGSIIESLIDIVSIGIPLVCGSLLGTYLVLYGGVQASLYYFIVVSAYEWISPILPYMNWFNKSVIGMVLPLSIILYIHRVYWKMGNTSNLGMKEDKYIGRWLISGILWVVLIWFMVGIFPIYPSIILSGSMQPVIQVGDVIVIKRLEAKEDLDSLEAGDIIQFHQGDKLITHRIKSIQDDKLNKIYETKGDNNLAIDEDLVRASEIRGKVVGIIPKVGWLPLIIKQGLKNIK